MGYSDHPQQQCSLGAAACYLLLMLVAALLMTSSHSEGKCFQWNKAWLSLFTCVDAETDSQNGPQPGPLAWQTFNTTASADGKHVTVQQNGLCLDYAPPPPGPAPRPPGPPPPPAPIIDPATVTFDLAELSLGLPSSAKVKVRDVWNKQFLPSLPGSGNFSTSVPHHGSVFLVFMPENSSWPLPFKLAPWMDKPAPPVPP